MIKKLILREEGKKHFESHDTYGWRARIQDNYKNKEEFEGYDEIYGICQRLGYDSVDECWDDNPMVQGSTHPADFKRSNNPRRARRTRLESHDTYGWRARIQDNYKTKEELERYDEIYGICQRLGYDSVDECWDDNPMVQGSTHPADFKRSNNPRRARRTRLELKSHGDRGTRGGRGIRGVRMEDYKSVEEDFKQFMDSLEDANYHSLYRVLNLMWTIDFNGNYGSIDEARHYFEAWIKKMEENEKTTGGDAVDELEYLDELDELEL